MQEDLLRDSEFRTLDKNMSVYDRNREEFFGRARLRAVEIVR